MNVWRKLSVNKKSWLECVIDAKLAEQILT